VAQGRLLLLCWFDGVLCSYSPVSRAASLTKKAGPFTSFSSLAKQQKIELGAFLVSDAAQNSYIFLFFIYY
jgi:hypothetical protein